MNTHIAYFDETGDDGVTTASSDYFILTSFYMSADSWQNNFNIMKRCRATLKEHFGLHTSEEIHTKHLVSNKGDYRKYNWSVEQKREILKTIALTIAEMDAKFVNVIIDKTKLHDQNYKVLENALTYNIQRIENDSKNDWNYVIITDQGRIKPMRKTARAIRAFNPIQSKYSLYFKNQPINHLIEDILEKNSKESHFIQICDFVSYFVYLYYRSTIKKQPMPSRAATTVDKIFVSRIMATLKASEKLNLKASPKNAYGLVVYPK